MALVCVLKHNWCGYLLWLESRVTGTEFLKVKGNLTVGDITASTESKLGSCGQVSRNLFTLVLFCMEEDSGTLGLQSHNRQGAIAECFHFY